MIKSGELIGDVKNPEIDIKIYIIEFNKTLLLNTFFILFEVLFFNVLYTGKTPIWQLKQKKIVAKHCKNNKSDLKPFLISIKLGYVLLSLSFLIFFK